MGYQNQYSTKYCIERLGNSDIVVVAPNLKYVNT